MKVLAQESVLLLDVSTRQGSELHLDLSTLQRPLLYQYVSTHLSCTWTFLHNRSLCFSWTRLHHRAELSCSWTMDMSGQHLPLLLLNVPRLQSAVACAAPGLVYTTEAYAAPRSFHTLGPELHLDVSMYSTGAWKKGASIVPRLFYTAEACAAPGHVYTTEACAPPGLVYTCTCTGS
jgi:hypothetical protein